MPLRTGGGARPATLTSQRGRRLAIASPTARVKIAASGAATLVDPGRRKRPRARPATQAETTSGRRACASMRTIAKSDNAADIRDMAVLLDIFGPTGSRL